MLDWWLDVPFEKLRSLGIGFVCLTSVTSSPDSVQSFLNWVTALQDRVRYVVFRNLKDGDYLPDYDKVTELSVFAKIRAAPCGNPAPRRRVCHRARAAGSDDRGSPEFVR